MDEFARIPASIPIEGFLWTWVIPAILFAIAFAATWMLYRHFASRGDE